MTRAEDVQKIKDYITRKIAENCKDIIGGEKILTPKAISRISKMAEETISELFGYKVNRVEVDQESCEVRADIEISVAIPRAGEPEQLPDEYVPSSIRASKLPERKPNGYAVFVHNNSNECGGVFGPTCNLSSCLDYTPCVSMDSNIKRTDKIVIMELHQNGEKVLYVWDWKNDKWVRS